MTHRRPHERAKQAPHANTTITNARGKTATRQRQSPGTGRAKLPFVKTRVSINGVALALAAGVSSRGARENVLASVNYGRVAHMNAADHGKSHRTTGMGYRPPSRRAPVPPPPCHRTASTAATPSYRRRGLMIARHAAEPPLGSLRNPRGMLLILSL